jgi:hypothetical protein
MIRVTTSKCTRQLPSRLNCIFNLPGRFNWHAASSLSYGLGVPTGRHFSSIDGRHEKSESRTEVDNAEPQNTAVVIGGTSTSERSQQTNGNFTENSDQFISHMMNGGTPCDPAPPPFRLADFGEESLHTLILLRHGESEWNRLNRYTGWCDVPLTKKGENEARDAGRLLHENGIEIDRAFTSVLKRSSFSCNMALNTAQQHWVPVTKSWRLNERHYGALQGYNKDTAYKELGIDQELVMQMRRSYHVRPPVMEDDHPYWHGNDRRYEE